MCGRMTLMPMATLGIADTSLLFFFFFNDTAPPRVLHSSPPGRSSDWAESREVYCYPLLRFLRGVDNMLRGFFYEMRHTPANMGRIHYLSNYYGFTLMDMVSYDHKHNEANGEGNRDGND